MPRKNKKDNLYKVILKKFFEGGVFGLVFVFTILTTFAFTEPSGTPSVVEPADANSTGQVQQIIGTPASVTTGTTNLFHYLRLIDTNIGGTPANTTASSSDDGTLVNLIGTNDAAANGQTIFNYLKKINDNLDFPETSSVLSSDTVKGASGSLSDCTDNNGGTCYISGVSKTALDSDLVAGNILSGTTIFGVTGTLQGAIYCDDDSDGYYSDTLIFQSSCSSGVFQVSQGNDCEDSCATCYPGSSSYQTSSDSLDQDCDSSIDEDDGPVSTNSATCSGNSWLNASSQSDANTFCSWRCDALYPGTVSVAGHLSGYLPSGTPQYCNSQAWYPSRSYNGAATGLYGCDCQSSARKIR